MDKIDEVLIRGVDSIYPSKELLEKVLGSGRKLKLYQGFDPTTPHLHLGHMVGLRKLRQFQAMGHSVIFLIGDFTGRIGDPTDKTAVRVRLHEHEIKVNLKTFKKQASRILAFNDHPNPATIQFNSKWLSKLTLADLIDLASHFTVQQLIERDMYQERIRNSKPVYLHEFFYPLMQAYDSVMLDVDLEIGGTDQIFNMLAGRTLMAALKRKDKYVLATKLLTDTAGNKMGKTTSNFISLSDQPDEMFTKVMSFPDTFLPSLLELLTNLPASAQSDGPMRLKRRIAEEIVTQVHGGPSAQKAKALFERVVQRGELPEKRTPVALPKITSRIIDVLLHNNLITSKSHGRRLIDQGGISVNRIVITNPDFEVPRELGTIVQVGKYTVGEIRKV